MIALPIACISVVEMHMPMQVIARLELPEKPGNGFEAPMRYIFTIVDAHAAGRA